LDKDERLLRSRRAVARKLSKLVWHFSNAMVCALCMDSGEAGCSDYEDVIKLYKNEIHAYARLLKTVRLNIARLRACIKSCLS